MNLLWPFCISWHRSNAPFTAFPLTFPFSLMVPLPSYSRNLKLHKQYSKPDMEMCQPVIQWCYCTVCIYIEATLNVQIV